MLKASGQAANVSSLCSYRMDLITKTYPISHRNERLNFPIPTKLEEPKRFKGWVLGTNWGSKKKHD